MKFTGHNKISSQELDELEGHIHSELSSFKREWKSSKSFDQVWAEYHIFRKEKKARHSLRWSSSKWPLAILGALMLSIGILLTAALFPSIGEALRGMSFVQRLYQGGLIQPEYQRIEQKKLAESLQYSMTDQGIALTVNEVFYDGINILISYEVVDTAGENRIQGSNPGPWLDYDFHGANRNGAMIEPNNTLIDPNHLEGVAIIHFIDDNLPDKMSVTLFSERITNVRGKWALTIPVSLQRSKPYTYTMYPNASLTVNGHTIKVKKLILGPVSNQITFTGESVSSYWGSMIKVMDDQGNLFADAGAGGTPGEVIRGFAPFTEHNPHPKYIKLIFSDPPKVSSAESSNFAHPKPKSTTIKIPLHWERKEQPEPERQPKNP
ncbi:DUF4179 domain-containing protein [Paenibacillus wulumuqiensis]|uniref:DUF4179 domain-containing protein n=1 Tax=Paenibacillus wulumuqiensis TaxID=1567107 RepID=UPI0006191436|nr:DUF4179 domain-containing protein [Paenibacillus wulumuqiensis]